MKNSKPTYFQLITYLGFIFITNGCTPRNDITPTNLPTLSNTSTATIASKVTPMVTKTPTESPTPRYYSQQRSETHRLIFSNLTETDQTIYSYDLESEKVETFFVMPTHTSAVLVFNSYLLLEKYECDEHN